MLTPLGDVVGEGLLDGFGVGLGLRIELGIGL